MSPRPRGLGLADLYKVYPDKVALVSAFLAKIDAEVLAGTPSPSDPEETARDRLFDAMMRRYDALRPYREALGAIRQAGLRDPCSALRRSGRRFAARWRRCLKRRRPERGLTGGAAQTVSGDPLRGVARYDKDETTDPVQDQGGLGQDCLKMRAAGLNSLKKCKIS
jgi:hypothetical protein